MRNRHAGNLSVFPRGSVSHFPSRERRHPLSLRERTRQEQLHMEPIQPIPSIRADHSGNDLHLLNAGVKR